ncbi:MAG: (Fe-S)-binding protein [Candidatus Korobacteraceae bacterium]
MADEGEVRLSEKSAIDRIAVFSRAREFEKAHTLLTRLQLPFVVLSPDPGYSRVGAPALICDSNGTSAILSDRNISCAGWADNFELPTVIPQHDPETFNENVFGEAAIMFFGPCMADETRVRLTVHLGDNLAPVLPYLNRTMPQACFNADPCSLTFMEGARMVTLYPQRIAIGKADGLVDGWRTLEKIRVLVNRTWAQRESMVPLYERRFKPPALEIYKRLPRTNCKECGEQTCMAFAVSLWQGRAVPSQCRPAFTDEYTALRAALLEICQGLGVDISAAVSG